jgi:hypothetical protein
MLVAGSIAPLATTPFLNSIATAWPPPHDVKVVA